MANTFKFGNKNWAVKEDYVLAYNDENSNFKPLPFDFTRSSTATYVDSDGLIKTAKAGHARIDYLDNADGHLLLEPARTNLITYSEDFTGWSLTSASKSLDSSVVSPEGSSGVQKLTSSIGSSFHFALFSVTLTGKQSFSVFLKKGTVSQASLFLSEVGNFGAIFDLENGLVESVSGSDNTAEIHNYGNGWYRCIVNHTSTDDLVNQVRIGVNNGAIGSFNADGTEAIYIYGAQVEAGSYATSYIPTEGSSVTRAREDIALTLPDDASFDSSNGFTIYGQFLTNGGSGSSSNFLQFQGNTGYAGFGSNSAGWRGRVNNGTDNELHNSSVSITTTSKLSISFDGDGYSMYANGTSFKTGSTDISTITSIDSVFFRDNTEEFGSMQIRELKLYNTRLTDAELATLTT